MLTTVQSSSISSAPAGQIPEQTLSLLVDCASSHLSGLKDKQRKSKIGQWLNGLPVAVRCLIAKNIDTKTAACLSKICYDRLSPPGKQAMLRHSAQNYGVGCIPPDKSWAIYVKTLATTPIPSGDGAEEHIILAGLLWGTLAPVTAVRMCHSSREVVLRAVSQKGSALKYASTEISRDREVVMCAVRQNGRALSDASDLLQNDVGVVLCAVSQDGRALGDASDALQNDRAVVMRAVRQNGKALQYASDRLQGDRAVVMQAISQNAWALGDASAALRCDREVVTQAVNQKGATLMYASQALQADPFLVELAGRRA